MSNPINKILFLAKWPIAVAVAVATPATALGLWELLAVAWHSSYLLTPFFVAMAITILAWTVLRRMKTVQFWCTLEHEMTHALFAYATFTPVREFKVTHEHVVITGDGSLEVVETQQAIGHVKLEGGKGDNWVVYLAPYFFPTAAFALVAAVWALSDAPSFLARCLLGVATGFSLVSTVAETHLNQTDLRRVGLFYCLVILPGLNLWMYGSIFAYELGGWDLLLQLARGINNTTVRWLGLA
jgi:hypothetical protein